MPNLSGKSRFPVDAALILRSETAGVINADTDLAVWPLVSKGAVWQNPADVRDGEVAVVGKFGAFSGDTTLAVEIWLAHGADKSSPKLYASFPVDTLGVVEIDFDEISALKRDAAATHWFVRLNVAGTAPSIASGFVYLAPPSPI